MYSPTSSPDNANHRKRSIARSFSSELGAVDEENCMRTSTEQDLSNMKSNSVPTSSETSSAELCSSGEPVEGIQTSPCPREVMKTKIRYHYMNPFQKFRARRRKPWKLVVQIVKIFLVTLQVRINYFLSILKIRVIEIQM